MSDDSTLGPGRGWAGQSESVSGDAEFRKSTERPSVSVVPFARVLTFEQPSRVCGYFR